ncbi:serine hydrolase domain-containing protein [Ruegeria aquimaris]|uniref:Beta-lactamase family protein n=1 Tax=Ruegeria aquimaris TaxID=2984333 RepID=A0ABT3AJX8_9RHOB|nr:serine hydrolase domain-containing protein [Ruegeria sp. XHP0148]MCV2888969.1 beta-lactamase family protein [Ruegeria sp. XHP0148]
MTYSSVAAVLAACVTILSMPPTVSLAQSASLEEALGKPGARVTIPVEAAKEPFPKAFVSEAQKAFNSFHAQMGGDHTLYYLQNVSSVMRTDLVVPNAEYRPFEYVLDPRIPEIVIETDSEGPMALKDYIVHPTFRHQAVMMVHEGKVVYEAYPGMLPTQVHLWSSASKTITGLLAAKFVTEGRIDPDASVTRYVEELVGTVWDQVRVIDLINHTTGLDTEENNQSILNPQSVFVRFLLSVFGSPDRRVEIEDWLQVLREVEPLPGEAPGEKFRYSSLNTHVLGMVVEGVAGIRVSDVIGREVWGNLTARMPLLVHLAPDGQPLNLGIVSSTLQDMARYATLWTPSWRTFSDTEIVTPEVLNLIRASGDPVAFRGGAKEAQALGLFAERPVKGAYQFDFIFEDGALYKHGNTGQGIYIDPERDFVAVMFSATPYVPPYGEIKLPAYMRAAAKMLAGG